VGGTLVLSIKECDVNSVATKSIYKKYTITVDSLLLNSKNILAYNSTHWNSPHNGCVKRNLQKMQTTGFPRGSFTKTKNVVRV
jgi:hypothetical protein